MPANSGALTGTIAHKHSALSADGGFLDDGVTGVTGTANGSLVYFDGSSIAQDLAAGNLNDVLTMGAAVPNWSAPAGGSSTWTTLADVEISGAPASLDTGVFAAHNVLAIYIFARLTVADGQAIIFNSDNGANQYCFRDIRNGTGFSTPNYPCIQYGFAATTNWINSVWTITQRTSTEKMINGFITEQTGTASTDIPSQAMHSAMWRNSADQITRVTLCNSAGVIVNIGTGSRIVVLGAS